MKKFPVISKIRSELNVLNISKIQTQLDDGEVLLELLLTEEALFVLTISSLLISIVLAGDCDIKFSSLLNYTTGHMCGYDGAELTISSPVLCVDDTLSDQLANGIVTYAGFMTGPTFDNL